MGGAAGENHLAHMGELQNRLGDFVLELPERGVEANEFTDDRFGFGDAILRQILGALLVRLTCLA